MLSISPSQSSPCRLHASQLLDISACGRRSTERAIFFDHYTPVLDDIYGSRQDCQAIYCKVSDKQFPRASCTYQHSTQVLGRCDRRWSAVWRASGIFSSLRTIRPVTRILYNQAALPYAGVSPGTIITSVVKLPPAPACVI